MRSTNGEDKEEEVESLDNVVVHRRWFGKLSIKMSMFTPLLSTSEVSNSETFRSDADEAIDAIQVHVVEF